MSAREGAERRRGPWATLLFGVGLGYFEAACVAYLKRLEALGQLAVTQSPFDNHLIRVEVGREAISLALLGAWAWASGRTRGERWGHFALAFGLWDLFYYLFLRWATGWPQSLMDWDVLFLIPAPWYGPVMAPVLVSILLAAGGLGVIRGERSGTALRLRGVDTGILVAGCVAVLAAFLWNAGVTVPFPEHFPWVLFLLGWGLAALATARIVGSMRAA